MAETVGSLDVEASGAPARLVKVSTFVSKLWPCRSLPHSIATRALSSPCKGGGGERKGRRVVVYAAITGAAFGLSATGA